MMETKSSRTEQARIQQAADEAFGGVADHEGDHPPAMQIMAELLLRNADPQVGQLRRRFFAFAIAALATAIFIILYLGVVKTTALPSELATARSDFETMAELASKAADETTQLRKSAEAATAELQQERQKTAALTSELATARSDFETMAELASKAADKAAQPKKSAEAVTAELQQERQKTAALTSELATTRPDFETKLVSSSTAADETAQLRKTAEAVTAELQQERQKTAALTSELATTRPDFETKLVSSSTAADETAQLRKTAEAATAELQQERQKTAALTSELAAAQLKATETVQLMQAEATESATLLKQAREKTTALAQEVADAGLITSTVKQLQALDVDGATAVLRQALHHEHDRAEALATELANARRAMEQKPAAVDGTPDFPLPAWANSYALVKPAQTAVQSDVATENSKSAIKPRESARVEHKQRGGYGCQHFRTYDPASGTYKGYDGRQHSCP